MSKESRLGARNDLRGWKEIASHLDVTSRTAQLWEKRRGLPVRRLPGHRGAVYAKIDDLERWRESRPAESPARAVATGVPNRRRPWYGGLLAVATGVIGLGAVLLLLGIQVPLPSTTLGANKQPSRSFEFDDPTSFAWGISISPDGRRLVYVLGTSDDRELVVLDLETDGRVSLAKGLHPTNPFWSPDAQKIAFFNSRAGILQILPAIGGEPVSLTRLRHPVAGGAWSPDGNSIVLAAMGVGLFEVNVDGGELLQVLDDPHVESPSFLPLNDGDVVLYASQANSTTDTRSLIDSHNISILWLSSGETQVVHRVEFSGPHPVYHSDGFVLFASGPVDHTRLMALPFSLEGLTATDESWQVQLNVLQASTAANGATAILDRSSVGMILTWRDRAGSSLGTLGLPITKMADHPRLSPNADRALISGAQTADYDIWIQSSEGARRVTFDSSYEADAVWAPDGRSIAFSATRDGAENHQMYYLNLERQGAPRGLSSETTSEFPHGWSPNGQGLLFSRFLPGSGRKLFYRSTFSSPARRDEKPFVVREGSHSQARWSPDGRLVAYQTSRKGQGAQIVIQRFDGTAEGANYAVAAGTKPRWSKEGSELVFDRRGQLYSIPVDDDGKALIVGKPQWLFELPRALGEGTRGYDVTPDGSRFLVVENHLRDGKPVKIDVFPGLPSN